MSGAIGFTRWESGTRGLWLEKRVALAQALRSRGHRVDWVNRLTKFSQQGSQVAYDPVAHEVLIVEFGSSNASFYGSDLEETQRIVARHTGKIVFVCDDPDLPYLWKTLGSGKHSQFTCWYNAAHPVSFGGQPETIASRSFPISGLIPCKLPGDAQIGTTLAYVGRPKGREQVFRNLFLAKAPIQIYGRVPEWDGYDCAVLPPPPQAARARFYGNQLGSLLIADRKHKRMGWYTGRAFHAIAAGTPAVAEHDHHAMTGLRRFQEPAELQELVTEWRENPQSRYLTWSAQADWVGSLKAICLKEFERLGL